MKYILTLILFAAFLNSSAQKSGLTVHEWGTFTSKYTGLGDPHQDVHKVIDEKVPSFVHHIDFEKLKVESGYWANKEDYYFQHKLLTLDDVSIKMETPVLYFYSNLPIFNLDVKVKFPKGSISEFYPMPYQKEDSTYVVSKVKFKATPNSEFGTPYLNFQNYNGFASWKINIFPSSNLLPSVPDDQVPHVWLAPRKTMANLIEANGEREKYIFYRGLASFVNPVIPRYTKSGNIIVKNTSDKNINYVMVYEITEDGKRFVWGKHKCLDSKGEIMFTRSPEQISDENWINICRPQFIDAMVSEGLYRDEAEAMLATWDKSYFEKPGIKVFWTVPRLFTDEILPLSFSIKPESLERVMVGRTEIDPFKTTEIANYSHNLAIETIKPEFTIFPNPTSSELFMRSTINDPETVGIEIIDFSGRIVDHCVLNLRPYTETRIPMNNLAKGVYLIKIENKEKDYRTHLNIFIQ